MCTLLKRITPIQSKGTDSFRIFADNHRIAFLLSQLFEGQNYMNLLGRYFLEGIPTRPLGECPRSMFPLMLTLMSMHLQLT